MQNLARFYTTSDLIANISATRQDIQNRKATWSRPIPPAYGETSPVNFGPLSRKFEVWVWTHPNRLFRETIFRPLVGAGPWNFFTRARVWPSIASTHRKPGRSPPPKKGQILRIVLKVQRVSAYNLGASGSNLTQLYQGTYLEAGVITWTLILEGVPEKIGRAKNVQNSTRSLATFDFERECRRNGST